MQGKECTIYENKICDGCGDCDFCDLNPDKICDNCGRCIAIEDEYNTLEIDDLLIDPAEAVGADGEDWDLTSFGDEDNIENVHHCNDHNCSHHHYH